MFLAFVLIATVVACFVAISNWEKLVYFFLFAVTFAGAIQLRMASTEWAVLLKDITLVIPCYLGIISARKRIKTHLPVGYYVALALFVLVILIQTLNPSGPPALARLVGLKVWLFYIPMIFVGAAMAGSKRKMVRCAVVALWLPCLVGLLQRVLVAAIGYQAAISLFFGDAGYAATQGYTMFEVGALGGQLPRIPSLFSYSAQYYNYLLCAMTMAWIAAQSETDRRWRSFANASLILAIVASFFSGIRAAFIFTPALVLTAYALKRDIRKMIVTGLLGSILVTFAFARLNINMTDLFDLTSDLTSSYSGSNGFGLIASYYVRLGQGVGAGTNAARYVADNFDINSAENYYAKTVYELGLPGLMILVMLLLVPVIIGFVNLGRLKQAENRYFWMGLLAFQLTLLVYNFKSTVLDLDPINSLYWLFVGMGLELKYIETKKPGRIRFRRRLAPQVQPIVPVVTAAEA